MAQVLCLGMKGFNVRPSRLPLAKPVLGFYGSVGQWLPLAFACRTFDAAATWPWLRSCCWVPPIASTPSQPASGRPQQRQADATPSHQDWSWSVQISDLAAL